MKQILKFRIECPQNFVLNSTDYSSWEQCLWCNANLSLFFNSKTWKYLYFLRKSMSTISKTLIYAIQKVLIFTQIGFRKSVKNCDFFATLYKSLKVNKKTVKRQSKLSIYLMPTFWMAYIRVLEIVDILSRRKYKYFQVLLLIK